MCLHNRIVYLGLPHPQAKKKRKSLLKLVYAYIHGHTTDSPLHRDGAIIGTYVQDHF